MKKSILLILLAVSTQVFSQKTKTSKTEFASIKIPLTPAKWEFEKGKIEFVSHKGVQAVRLNENSGVMIFKDLIFKNGIIEFDVEVSKPNPFPTIYFHWQDKNETEHVYMRTGTQPKKNAFDAIQYAAIVNGVNLWDLSHEYQSAANIKINEWNHVKLVVSGKQLRVYVNSSSEPTLEIPCMEGNTSEGKIGIGTGFAGEVVFANVTVAPNAIEGLTEMAGPDITQHDTRYIRAWQISKPDSLPYGKELNAFMLPKENITWQSIVAERRGLVNISRKLGNSEKRRYVWLKANIKSGSEQKVNLKLGFSDEVWVFVNQKPVYVDKDIYYQNMRKSPNGRISLDNSQFDLPLRQGENELLIGIANDFYGWGLMARLEHLDGIEITQ